MNIRIDTSPLANSNAVRGVGRYTRELVQSLQALGSSHSFFTSENSPDTVDIVHYPFFDFFFATLPFFKKAKTIVTIHDVIPLLFPKHYPMGIRGRLRFLRQRLALRSVSHVITDSEVSKRDIVDHLKISSEKVSVVPLAAGQDIKRPLQPVLDAVRKKYNLPKNFVLYVGDINYNKNLPFLIHVMKKIPTHTLVFVGSSFNNTQIPEGRAIHSTIESLGMQKRVRCIDNVVGENATDLPAIYALASVYVQPSLYEGFGLPVLEAMQCKTPVVCSKAGSLPEVGGSAALYFHPMEEQDCKDAIMKVLRASGTVRARMVRKGVEQAEQFTWKKTAQNTLSVYESVG